MGVEKQKKEVGTGVKFERIRRITGYLVGTVDRFNNGKKAEEKDRVKHTIKKSWSLFFLSGKYSVLFLFFCKIA